MKDQWGVIDEMQLTRVELEAGRQTLERIATAVEKIAASPDPKKPLNLRDLTDDERKVIEALRDGTLTLVPKERFVPSGRQTTYIITGEIDGG
jgi:hypothetical protein